MTVKMQPQTNVVRVYEALGVRRESPGTCTYYGRFEQVFVTGANEFMAACLDGGKLPVKMAGSVQAVKIGCALQESLVTGAKIWFDETGSRVEKAQL